MEQYLRYDKREKRHRNHLLCQYAKDHPELSDSKIGAIFRITKQRVRIIKTNGERK